MVYRQKLSNNWNNGINRFQTDLFGLNPTRNLNCTFYIDSAQSTAPAEDEFQALITSMP